MKTFFKFIVLIVSLAAAFMCFTVNVGTSNAGGISGTVAVHQGISGADIAQIRSSLRVTGFGWIVIAFGVLVWILRGTDSKNNSLSILLRRVGFVTFGIGVISGLCLVVIFGSDSREFQRYFGYCICSYMLGSMLIWLGRKRDTTNPCGVCRRPMMLTNGMIMRTTDLRTHTQGCYQCRACGRLTCYDCSDSRKPCVCKAHQWSERTYLMR